jgi:putative zinc finger/helix-turn-helix YgiT family protein
MNTCPLCGSEIRRERLEAYPYTESGLPNVVLEGVYQVSCSCGELDGVEIPSMDQLNRALAYHLVRSEDRLSGPEIRSLRTWLGWSGKTFAEKLGVTPETVSRWEHGTKEMNLSNERLLRLYVAEGQQDHDYSVGDTERVKPVRSPVHPPLRLRAESGTGEWMAA